MLTPALLLILGLAQSAEPAPWRPLPSDAEITNAWRPAADDAGEGDLRRVVMRVSGPNRGWAWAEMEVEYACAAQTWTILSAQSFDDDGAVLQSVTATEDQLRPRPLYAEDAGSPLYAELCPEGAPLDPRPVHPPPIPVPPPYSR